MPEKTLPSELAPARQKFLELIADIRPELHRYCARITGSVISGEDIVQDAIAKVFYEISMATELPPLRPLLFRVAHNAALDFLRRYEQKHVELVAEIPDDQLIDDADPMVMRAALASFLVLPIRQRSAVILKDVLGLTGQEIADATQTTVPAVKAALVRGRATLRAEAAKAESAPAMLPADELAQLHRYVTLFNARDWDGVRGLLADECRLDLVSQAARQGKAVGQYFGRYAVETELRLVVGTLEGRGAIAVYRSSEAEAPAYFMLLQWDGGQVTSIRDFRYVPYIAERARFVTA